jgi:hypothetical protein
VVVGKNEVFLSVPLSSISAGTYEFIRVSVTYQDFDIVYNANGFNNLTGTLASFIGFNTYITSYNVNQKEEEINANKLQGYWGFESTLLDRVSSYPGKCQRDSPRLLILYQTAQFLQEAAW